MRTPPVKHILECTECGDNYIKLGNGDSTAVIRSIRPLRPSLNPAGNPMQGVCPKHAR